MKNWIIMDRWKYLKVDPTAQPESTFTTKSRIVMNRHIAIYPGSFDPFTHGHMDIARRGLEIFDTVVIAVSNNSEKRTIFNLR